MTNSLQAAIHQRDSLARQQAELQSLRDRLTAELHAAPPTPVTALTIDKLLAGDSVLPHDAGRTDKQLRARACDEALRRMPEEIRDACERVMRLQERAIADAVWRGSEFARARRAWKAALAAIAAAQEAEREAVATLDLSVVGYVPPDPLSGQWTWLDAFRAWSPYRPQID
ncbi:MAG: hypothetical protein ACOZD0_14470 [Pseudomonadota bacterium]